MNRLKSALCCIVLVIIIAAVLVFYLKHRQRERTGPQPYVEKAAAFMPPQAQPSAGWQIVREAVPQGAIALVKPDWVQHLLYRWEVLGASSLDVTHAIKEGWQPQRVDPGGYKLRLKRHQHGSGELLLPGTITVGPGELVKVKLTTGVEVEHGKWVKVPYEWGLADASGNPRRKLRSEADPRRPGKTALSVEGLRSYHEKTRAVCPTDLGSGHFFSGHVQTGCAARCIWRISQRHNYRRNGYSPRWQINRAYYQTA